MARSIQKLFPSWNPKQLLIFRLEPKRAKIRGPRDGATEGAARATNVRGGYVLLIIKDIFMCMALGKVLSMRFRIFFESH